MSYRNRVRRMYSGQPIDDQNIELGTQGSPIATSVFGIIAGGAIGAILVGAFFGGAVLVTNLVFGISDHILGSSIIGAIYGIPFGGTMGGSIGYYQWRSL